jgi:Fur family transcriptional regulator, peroxide stress response regulator
MLSLLILGTITNKMNRNTKQREAILSILRNTISHPTADSIYEQVRKTMPNISKGTVYRNLQVLQKRGEIRELNLAGTKSRYEVDFGNHYHFRCEVCGKVMDLDQKVDTELDREISRKTGLKILYHQLEFRGICNDCRSKVKKEAQGIQRSKKIVDK